MATIDGKFHGAAQKMIYLEELSPYGSKIIDSTTTAGDGSFFFEIKMDVDYPSFYNVRMGRDYVPLLLERGEQAEVDAVGNIYYNYNVKGSEGSMLVKEFNNQVVSTSRKLDSLMALYERSIDPVQVQSLGVEYGQTYIELKRSAIRFITEHSSSLAALLPLYQPIFSGKFIFDEPQDIIYLRMLSDSLMVHYPLSPYVRSLSSDVQGVRNAFKIDSMVNVGMENGADYPEIEMNDSYGVTRHLSELKGKVVLLDFTASVPAELKILNREKVAVYDKYKGLGFEIFQVSLDRNKAAWLKTTVEQRLPWISVCDFEGGDSPAVRNYNVQSLPANFLIDKQGVIVGRNLHGEQLEQALDELL